jgi:hypothetical protein
MAVEFCGAGLAGQGYKRLVPCVECGVRSAGSKRVYMHQFVGAVSFRTGLSYYYAHDDHLY